MAFKHTLKKAMAAALAPALFAAAAFFANPVQADGGPALWKLSDHDSNIYLFGTIHILKPETKWRTDTINKAINGAQTIYFEAPTNELSQQQQMQMLAPLITNPQGVTLSSRISPRAKELLAKEAGALGIPVAALEPYRPWFAGLNLAVTQMIKSGYSPDSGVENVIYADAKQASKALGYFETAEFQMKLLATLGGEDEDTFFEETMKEFHNGPALLNQMVTHWAKGEADELAILLNKSMEISPKFKKAALDDRNMDWANQIDRLMQGSGNIFIAVGAGHLAGENSVQQLLEAKGYKIVRQ